MAAKSTTRILIRPSKRLTEAAQRRFVEPGDVVYVIGKGETTREDWINSLRTGDLAKVVHMELVAEPKTRKMTQPVESLFDGLKAIRKAGAVLLEASTGKRSDSACDYDAMLNKAIKAIRTGKKGGVREAAGRPANDFGPTMVDMFEREWNSRKNATRADVIKAIKAKLEKPEAKRINLTAVRRALQRAGKI